MHWFRSFIYPYEGRRYQTSLIGGMVVFYLSFLFAGMVGGGFLYTVGFKTIALGMGLFPVFLTCFLLICMGAGYFWAVVTQSQEPEAAYRLPGFSGWPRYLIEGGHLLLFYALTGVFLVAATMVLYPVGLIIPGMLLVFYPLLLVPMAVSGRDKTFLGLMDGCLDMLSLFQGNYFKVWLEMTLYLVVGGGVIIPILILTAALTGVGALLIPGLLFAWGVGFANLLATVTDGLLPVYPLQQPGTWFNAYSAMGSPPYLGTKAPAVIPPERRRSSS